MRIFWGKKGAGKTSHAVRLIREYYKKGLDVITNIHINIEALPKTKKGGRIFKTDNPEDLAYFRGEAKKPKLFVFDEAYLKFNSRNWKDLPQSTHELMAQSRKIHCEIIIIAQGFKRIDIVLREITDEFVRFKPAIFGYGYHEVREELSLLEENKLVPIGSEDPKIGIGLNTLHWHRKKNWATYNTDQLYGSLLLGLKEKKFYDIVRSEYVTFPEKIDPFLQEDTQLIEQVTSPILRS